MIKLISLIITLWLTQHSFSQGFINSDRSEAKNYLSKYIKEEKLQTTTIETDSTITFLVRDTTVQNLDLVLHFDESGKCDKELRILTCDSCLEKTLNETLNKNNLGWTKVDSKTYLSKFKKHLKLRLHIVNATSFEIVRIDLSKKEYKQLLKK